MKTKQAAINYARKNWHPEVTPTVFVFQYPKGHWGVCSPSSPVGESLNRNGMIYPELGAQAREWEPVDITR
jgi:hypothetical protein